MEQKRLEPQYETRQTGWQINTKTGLPEPVTTTYHVGHGQQIARRDLADRLTRHEGAVEVTTVSRQQQRRPMIVARKSVAADKAREERDAALKAHRAASAPQIKARRERQANRAAARKKPHPHGDLKFLNRGARLRVLAERAEVTATEAPAKPARKSRAKAAA